jgi:hypothetical protein
MTSNDKPNPAVVAAARPRPLKTSLGTFMVAVPTSSDNLDVIEAMKELAKSRCLSPLDYVLANAGKMSPGELRIAMDSAVAMGAGSGGPRPSPQLIEEQYVTAEGLLWRLMFHIRKLHPDFTEDKARQIIDTDGRWNLAVALDEAIGFGNIDPKKDEPQTGTSS